MNLFFVVDEYTDLQPASVVRSTIDIVLDALANPHNERPDGEILLGQVVKECVLHERCCRLDRPRG